MIKLTVGVETKERNGRSNPKNPRNIIASTPITPNTNVTDNRQWPTGWMYMPVYLFNKKTW